MWIISTLYTQHQYAYSPNCSLYISKSTDKENLLNKQELLKISDRFLYSCDLNV